MSLTEQNIEKLLKLCSKGNQLAQLEVYNRYHRAMFNTAMRIVKDTALAEDVTQESFIAAFSKLKSFKGKSTFGAWLKRIVINKGISEYKKSQRYVAIDEQQLPEEVEDMDGITECDYKGIQSSDLLMSMNELNDNYRQVLSLHFIEGYDYEEICEILQIGYGNCRTLISRAKESLRKKLAYAS